MANPAPQLRNAPTGIHLFDGFTTKIAMQLAPAVDLWEKSVTPNGVDGGDPVDQTTMWNQAWRTQTPRKLKSLMDCTAVCAYDPIVYQTMISIINIIQQLTVYFSDGSTLAYWGWVRKFEPNEHKEGEQPEATVTLTHCGFDPQFPAGKPVEFGPQINAIVGT